MNQPKTENQMQEANEVIMDVLILLQELSCRIEAYRDKFNVSTEEVPDFIPANLLEGED